MLQQEQDSSDDYGYECYDIKTKKWYKKTCVEDNKMKY